MMFINTTTSPENTYRPDSSEHMLTHTITNFEKKNKQTNHYGQVQEAQLLAGWKVVYNSNKFC